MVMEIEMKIGDWGASPRSPPPRFPGLCQVSGRAIGMANDLDFGRVAFCASM